MKIVVIDNYDSFTWNLVHYLEEIGATTEVYRNDVLSAKEILDLSPNGIVLSPGPCTPQEAGVCMDVVRQSPSDMPILGVCLGHQSIGQALGASIITAKTIMHGKKSIVYNSRDYLFKGLPERFNIVRYHSLAVSRIGLPDCLKVDSYTEDGEIMSLRHITRPVFGVQFHPESIQTENGHALLRNFLRFVD